MPAALWLLLRLRFKAWLRRFGRNLRSPKGIALTAAGLLVFLTWLLPSLLAQGMARPGRLQWLQDKGPWMLLAYSLITLLLASGERAITFSPPEVNLLFPGPFSRRQLLGYKMASSLGLVLFSSLFMTVFLGQGAVYFLPGYVGMVLSLEFMQLLAMAVGLVTANVGTLARSWRRRAVLVVLAAVVAAALWQVGFSRVLHLPPARLFELLEQSGPMRVVLEPFRWFVRAFTAERIWPDLVQWAGLGLAVNVGLAWFVLRLDAQYLEVSAASSERIYARLERMRRGGVSAPLAARKSGKARVSLPMPPYWAGAGPIAWRQATSAARDVTRLISIMLIFIAMSAPILVGLESRSPLTELALVVEGTVLAMSLVLTSSVPFDFRADLDRIAELKALPISPAALSLGQLLTPVAIVTLLQTLVLTGVAAIAGSVPPLYWPIACFALPANTLLFGIENLTFLWFPVRMGPATPGDIQNMGRMSLLMLAKFLLLAVGAAIAGGCGALTYFLSGQSMTAALVVAWVTLLGLVAALIPLVALAFRQFDVARDLPL